MSGGSGAELLPPDTLPVKATGKLKVVIPGGGERKEGAKLRFLPLPTLVL